MAEQTRRNAATDDGGSGLLSQLPVDRLRDEAVGFGRAFGKRSLNRLGSGVEGITERLSGFVDGIPLKNEAKQSKGDSSVKAGAKAAVDLWYAEVNQYNFAAPAYSNAVGHFTQVVWREFNQAVLPFLGAHTPAPADFPVSG